MCICAVFITLHGRRVFPILTIKYNAPAAATDGSTNPRHKIHLRVEQKKKKKQREKNKSRWNTRRCDNRSIVIYACVHQELYVAYLSRGSRCRTLGLRRGCIFFLEKIALYGQWNGERRMPLSWVCLTGRDTREPCR